MFDYLFLTHSAVQAIVVFSLCIITGILFGQIKIGTISLGVGGVLFSSLAAGHFGLGIDIEILHFAREFGLILFVYSVGMQVGPGFIESLKRSGLSLNLMAAFIVCFGTVIAGLCFIVFDVPLPVIVGLYSGGVTNTPSLAAATQTFADILPEASMLSDYISQAGLGYAAAYPFGILGIIASILIVRFIFRIDIEKENKAMEDQNAALKPHLDYITVEVTNEALVGKRLDSIKAFKDQKVVFSRIEQMKGIVQTPKPDTIITLGTLIHAVGDVEELEKLIEIVGKVSDINLKTMQGPLDAVYITVTKDSVAGKSIKSLKLTAESGMVATRISRSGFEFTALPTSVLHFGDLSGGNSW